MFWYRRSSSGRGNNSGKFSSSVFFLSGAIRTNMKDRGGAGVFEGYIIKSDGRAWDKNQV